MYAIPNVMNRVLPLLAVIDGKIVANGVLIGANGALIATNANAIISNAGAISANADAIAAIGYVDRGDIDAFDKTVGDLTIDSDWHDLNLSSIVGATQRLVLLRVRLNCAAAHWDFKLRTKGYTDSYNERILQCHIANKEVEQDIWLYTDESGIIQYYVQLTTWATIDILVRGWFE